LEEEIPLSAPEELETLNIREMAERDLEKIVQLEHSAFLTSWSSEAFAKAIRDPKGFNRVAEDLSGLVGYLTAFSVLDEAFLTNLFVVSHCRRRGVGKRLLNNLIGGTVKKGVKQIFLEVREENVAAIRLYEEMDFSIVAVRKGYYADTGEDALVMQYSHAGKFDKT